MTRTAIIIGSGIAGPLTALALRKAGVAATIYEAHPEHASSTGGIWLTVAVNGLQAFRTLGLHDAVKAAGFPSERIDFASGSGKYLGSVPIGGKLADGSVTHTLKRADLLRVIQSATQTAGIETLYEKRLVAAEHDASGVVAHFSDGSAARADFLVGADGVHSQVRTLIDPHAPRPTYAKFLNSGGFAPVTPQNLAPCTYNMVFGTRAFFGYTISPSREGWWFVNLPHERELRRSEFAEIDWRARFRDAFADDAGPMLELIDATPGPLNVSQQFEVDTVPSWHAGRMVILGDAAHAASPASGQGASMAAEDAIALALAVRDHASIEQGLARFVEARRPRAERVVAYGRRSANMKLVGPVGRFFRDLMLPHVFKMLSRPKSQASLDWLFEYRAEWTATGA